MILYESKLPFWGVVRIQPTSPEDDRLERENMEVIEKFTVGKIYGIESSPRIQNLLGTKIYVDIPNRRLLVPTGKGTKSAKVGDSVILYSDGSLDVMKGTL